MSHIFGVSASEERLRTPKYTPKLHGFNRMVPDAIRQQKTRYPK